MSRTQRRTRNRKVILGQTLRKPVQDVDWIKRDIRDDLGDIFIGTDFVFHLAALANARRCGEKPNLCVTTNILGTANVLQAALKSNVSRVILASSSWVAGTQIGDVVDERSPFDITTVNNIYGTSKLAQEMLCYSFYNEFGAPAFTILRYGIPYGERMWKGLVVRAFMMQAERYRQISIMGDGKQYREFLYVGDLCDAQILSTNYIGVNKVYNLTGPKPVTVEELAKEVVKHFPASIDYIPQARIEPKLKRIKNDLARTELEWQPKMTLEEGIERCVAWWKYIDQAEKDEDYWC